MRLNIFLLAIASTFLASGGSAHGQEAGRGPCTIHLWGAQRDFTNDRRLAGPAAPRGSRDADRSNVLANIDLLDPVRRAGDLDDAALSALIPDAGSIAIVRHPRFVEIGVANRARAPLHEPDAQCSADLIVMDLYDIDGPTDSRGLLVDLLRAPNGWHVTYIFRRFDGVRLVSARRDSFVAPLRLPRSDWPNNPAAAIAAIDEAMDASLQIFRRRLEGTGR